MDASPRFSIAYLQGQQAQKHVTVNDALRRLDALVSLSVKSRGVDEEPSTPAEGDAYIMTAAPSGAIWSSFAPNALAVFQDGAWAEIGAVEGLRAYVVDEAALVAYASDAWSAVGSGGGGIGSPSQLGVNTTADTTNRLAVKSDAVLFSHNDVTPGSGDARCIVNKSATGNTASVLFQSGYSGRAEFGLAGDDDFHMKVSPDGSSFYEGVKISHANGKVSFPSGLASALSIANGGTGGANADEALGNLGFSSFMRSAASAANCSTLFDTLTFRYNLGNVADDGAGAAALGTVYGSLVMIIGNTPAAGVGLYYVRTAATVNITELFQAGAVINIVAGDGALTGASSTDGKCNIRAESATGNLWIENRTGATRGYRVFLFN